MTTAQPTDALTAISFFLTLAGLLGTFFYIHLGEWYRDVQALAVKWEINKLGEEESEKTARRECRYEAEQMAGWTILTTSIAITLFIILIALLSIILWVLNPDRGIAWVFVGIVGIAFLVAYLLLSGYFLILGYRKARKIWREAADAFPLPKQRK